MSARLLPGSLLCLALAYLLVARGIPMDPWTAAETINTRTLPLVYGTLLALCCLWLLARPQGQAEAHMGWLRLFGALTLVVFSLVLLQLVPFWLMLGALLYALAFWLGERRQLPMLLVSVAVPLLGWVAVELLLGLRLPS